ncbi:NAD(P)-binding protein [Pyrenochaeta sp. DS3sAY3a]|nr:NAD(P)-binding protein [Pyrenochaeta sp. DS3sAY3a]
MPRHILVFGGTSPTGIDFCLAALRDGHTLTLYVRNASKLPTEISSNVNIVVGNLTDASKVEEAASCGAKTVVSFIGPVMGDAKKGHTPISDGYRVIIPLLKKYKYERTLNLSTASYKVPQDRFSFTYALMVWFIYLFVRPAYVEINTTTRLITELRTEDIKWTVFRVPGLGNKDAKPVKAAFVGEGVGIFLERKGIAEWVLKEMEEEKWVGKCPALSNA